MHLQQVSSSPKVLQVRLTQVQILLACHTAHVLPIRTSTRACIGWLLCDPIVVDKRSVLGVANTLAHKGTGRAGHSTHMPRLMGPACVATHMFWHRQLVAGAVVSGTWQCHVHPPPHTQMHRIGYALTSH